MRIVFLSSSILPKKTGNGSSVLTYGFINMLRTLGHKVFVVPVSYRGNKSDLESDLLFLKNNNFETRIFDHFLEIKSTQSKLTLVREILAPKSADHYYTEDNEKVDLTSFIKKENIDLLIGYSWEALALIHNIKNVKKVISIVDLLNHRYEQRQNGLNHYHGLTKIKKALILKRERDLFDYTISFLKEMNLIIEHAYQHADELRNLGLKNVAYFPHPLPIQQVTYASQNDKFNSHITILILGSLKGIASRLGFEYFLDQMLPQLKEQSSKLNKPLRFRIVGHGKMLPSLKKRLIAEENIDFIGFAESIQEEYRLADIMLVTIPISHGFRTRIAEAFSYGICVVAHSANAEGMPEIKNETNAIIDKNPHQLVEKLIRVANDANLRYQIGLNAIKTFEEEISQKSAILKLEKLLNSLEKDNASVELL